MDNRRHIAGVIVNDTVDAMKLQHKHVPNPKHACTVAWQRHTRLIHPGGLKSHQKHGKKKHVQVVHIAWLSQLRNMKQLTSLDNDFVQHLMLLKAQLLLTGIMTWRKLVRSSSDLKVKLIFVIYDRIALLHALRNIKTWSGLVCLSSFLLSK